MAPKSGQALPSSEASQMPRHLRVARRKRVLVIHWNICPTEAVQCSKSGLYQPLFEVGFCVSRVIISVGVHLLGNLR